MQVWDGALVRGKNRSGAWTPGICTGFVSEEVGDCNAGGSGSGDLVGADATEVGVAAGSILEDLAARAEIGSA